MIDLYITGLSLNRLYPAKEWLQTGDADGLVWGRRTGEEIVFDSGLSTLPLAAGEPLRVIIPAEWATVSSVNFPGKNLRQFARAVPYLVEEQLATDVETLHFAWGEKTSDGDIPVVVIARELMDQLLTDLGQAGIKPAAVLVDAQLLPVPDKSATGLVIGERLLLRDHTTMLAVPLSESELAVQSMLSANETHHLRLYAVDQTEAMEIISTPGVELELLETPPEKWLISRAGESSWPINLLQGDYRPAGTGRSSRQWWKTAAVAATLLVCLQTTYWLAAGWVFATQAEKHHQTAVTLYREYFPEEKTVIDPLVQAQGHLRNIGSGSGDGFIDTYRQLGSAWKNAGEGDATIRSLRYQDNRIDVDIRAPSVHWVESLIGNLQAQGVQSRLLSASQRESQTLARIRVGDNNG